MKINKLVLKNFRSYEEKTVFDFTTTNYKNIILRYNSTKIMISL